MDNLIIPKMTLAYLPTEPRAKEMLDDDYQPKVPEHKLMLAILRRTRNDLIIASADIETVNARHDAAKWVLSDSNEPYSFIWIVNELFDDISIITKYFHELTNYTHF